MILAITLDECWDFFANPQNLPNITPPWLKLRITSDLSDKIYEGMIITYKVQPFLRIPSNWVTEITHVKEKRFFIDEQRFGPYKFWHHQHHFNKVDNGVEIADIVHYAIPFESFSSIFLQNLIQKRVKEIFKFREGSIKKLFIDER
jgi:ligand-binding SRPBCC domain-containing protein